MIRCLHSGFTLLEVLVALTILSIIALLAVKNSGDTQAHMSETQWQDEVALLGRGKLVQLLRQSPENLEQHGTLAPELPGVEWYSHVIPLQAVPEKRLELRLMEMTPFTRREMVLEYILPR